MNEEQTKALLEQVKNQANEVLASKDFASKTEIAEIKESIEKASTKEDVEKLVNQLEEVALEVKAISENPSKEDKGLLAYIKENSETFKSLKNKTKRSAEMTIKATQVASDINSGTDYAEMITGTVRKPVRRTFLMDLFNSRNVSTEYIKYREENVVTRDGKFVVACATSTHDTKKSWVVRTVELAKIRDIVDACIDMLDDYDWVEAEIRQLINESLMLKAEYELLLGTSGSPTEMLSIDSISSEFNPANPLADFSAASGTPFQDANVEQLTDAMAGQIAIFGQENRWMADSILMNYKDFINYRNLKDSNGNRLLKTLSDDVATIAGLRVYTSPLVESNSQYVFDSSQGEIMKRKDYTLNVSTENKDNIEHETVTFVAYARMQFHVAMINRDAFMKCTDVASAITAITAP